MSEWKENVILESVCAEVLSGGTPRTSIPEYYLNGTVPWLKTKEVTQNRIYKTENFISREGLENSAAKILPVNSIVVAMFGDGKTAGRVGLTKLPLTTNQACCNLVIDPEIACPTFIFYQLIGKYDELVARKTGSGQQNLSPKLIRALPICLPALDEQRAIANMLSSLDDKIDLLHRQNKTLEAMAETLFRQWFVEEANDDWEEGTLGEVIEIFDGKRVPLSKLERDKRKSGQLYPYYGAAKVMDYVNDYIFDGDYILMGEDGTVRTDEGLPILQFATGKFWVNNHAHVLKAKPPYSDFFLWKYLSRTNIDQIVTGAVQPKINQGNLKTLPFPRFPSSTVLEFNSTCEPIRSRIQQNYMSIKSLEKLRDTLLPKLMSGEVRVQYE